MNETNNVTNGSVYRPNMSSQRPQTMSGVTTPPGNAVQQGYMPGPGNAQMGYWGMVARETPEQTKERARIGSKLFRLTLAYALFFTFCLYNNPSGVTMPLFAAGTLVYICYMLNFYGVKIKKSSYFYGAVILGLSISNMLTGNSFFIFFNCIGILLLTFVFLLHNVYDDSKWNLPKTTIAILESSFGSLGCLDDYIKDKRAMKEHGQTNAGGSSGRNGILGSVILGLVIAVPVVAIILALLVNADVVFKTLVTDYLSIKVDGVTIFGVVMTFIFSYFASFCIMRFFAKKRIKEEVTSHNNFEPVVAITVLSIIGVIYMAFSLIQIIFLFWGGMELPDGYTYAEYAREGFFQLLTVCIINVIIVIFVKDYYREHVILKGLMTLISLCTYIMIASSGLRMLMYIDSYNLSFDRILVLWTLAVLSFLLVGIIVSIYKSGFPLFRYGVVIVSIFYMALSFSHTDNIIARYNLSALANSEVSAVVDDEKDNDFTSRKEEDLIDYYYLVNNLSTDAAPAMKELCPKKYRDQYFNRNAKYYNDTQLRHFNVSRYTAKMLAESK